MSPLAHPRILPDEFESYLHAFETAWHSAEWPDWHQFVAGVPNEPAHLIPRLLWELAAIDIEMRWRRGLGRPVEEYIAQDDPQAATAVVLKIVRAVSHLKEQPGIGRSGRVPGTKELIVPKTPFIVPYRVKDDTVQILRFYHSSRVWPDRL